MDIRQGSSGSQWGATLPLREQQAVSGDLCECPKLVGVGGGWVQASRGAACLQSEDDPTTKNSPAQQVSAPKPSIYSFPGSGCAGRGATC